MGQDVRWTKALKYMLTDLKWCMSWMISRQDGGFGLHDVASNAQNADARLAASSAPSLQAIPRAARAHR